MGNLTKILSTTETPLGLGAALSMKCEQHAIEATPEAVERQRLEIVENEKKYRINHVVREVQTLAIELVKHGHYQPDHAMDAAEQFLASVEDYRKTVAERVEETYNG